MDVQPGGLYSVDNAVNLVRNLGTLALYQTTVLHADRFADGAALLGVRSPFS